MRMGKHLSYPSLAQLLLLLGEDAILVGSAARCERRAKDYDFVVNRSGLARLIVTYGYYLIREQKGWYVFLPEISGEPVLKAVDFFCGLQPINNVAKYGQRITWEDASNKHLQVKEIAGIEVLCWANPQA